MTRVSLQGTKYDIDAFDNVINVWFLSVIGFINEKENDIF
jgi:hypothetical protein